MKWQRSILLAVLLMALPIMNGCAGSSKISAEEAIAIVIQSGYGRSIVPGWENESIPEQCPHPASWGEWSASYESNGHWIVTGVFDYSRPPWNLPEKDVRWDSIVRYDYFENSGIVQLKEGKPMYSEEVIEDILTQFTNVAITCGTKFAPGYADMFAFYKQLAGQEKAADVKVEEGLGHWFTPHLAK